MEDKILETISVLTGKRKYTIVWNQTERMMVDIVASSEMEAYNLWRSGKFTNPETIDIYQQDADDYFIEEVDMQEEDFE